MDKQNRAGYSPIMLTALAALKTQDDTETLLQLFRLGDVNAKASQVGPGAAHQAALPADQVPAARQAPVTWFPARESPLLRQETEAWRSSVVFSRSS